MNFCCDICSKTFGRKEHLTRHMKHIQEEYHEENIEMCESYFRKERSLKLHICLCVKMGKKTSFVMKVLNHFPEKQVLIDTSQIFMNKLVSHACQFCSK